MVNSNHTQIHKLTTQKTILNSDTYLVENSKIKSEKKTVVRNAYVHKVTEDPTDATKMILSCRMLTNKEFCSACARGQGCGAVFFNQLTELGRTKDHIDISVDKTLCLADQIQASDIISVSTSKFNYWTSLLLFYMFPIVFTIFIPLVVLSLYQVNQLVIVGIITILTILYYSCIGFFMKDQDFEINYIKIEQKGSGIDRDSTFSDSNSHTKEL